MPSTSPNSQKEQRRDIESFITFMEKVDKTDERICWTSRRLSEAYKEQMRSVIVAAVRRQLGHKNAAYSMQYARMTSEELQGCIER